MSCKDVVNLEGGRVCTGRVDQASLSRSESNVSTRLLVRSTYMVSEKRLGGIRDIFDTEARKPPIREEDKLFQAERHVSNPPQLLT
jgi:limonene-1,2-epoxide hydrolase